MPARWWLLFAAALMAAAAVGSIGVDYDARSLIIHGNRRIIFSGSIHYPRSTPDMWPLLISEAKRGGLSGIDTYVFWNLHEPKPGQYDFNGRYDLVGFIKQVQAQGLYVCLRIGPFIEGEWSYGGLPFWLRDVPGIVFRTDNKPFKDYMRSFVTKVVDLMKSESLFASQGGPIILTQIENEYQNVERAFHEGGQRYVKWATDMAVGLETGVPWAMCKQDDAPDPVINACNGLMCGVTFQGPNSPNKPAIWTENWTQLFEVYGNTTRTRKPEDIAYHAALFIVRKNGSYINYYMYHGGTNFGRVASEFVTTSYYDHAPLDEYGLINQPMWGHLKELHSAVKLCSHFLLYGVKSVSVGEEQEVYVYTGENGECAAFLVNELGVEAVFEFRNMTYHLPSKSISILADCKTEVYNTAKVNTQFNTRTRQTALKLDSIEMWEQIDEPVLGYDDTLIRSNSLLEQINTTKDFSDYLWYTTSYEITDSSQAMITVNSRGHALSVFANGVLIGSSHGAHRRSGFILETSTPFNGVQNISLLNSMVGLPDSGAFMETRAAGLLNISIQENEAVKDLTNYAWGYQVGLLGEKLEYYSDHGSSLANWKRYTSVSQPLTWYKSNFDAPSGYDPIALNLASMGKGEAWINGQSIGRYWISFHKPDGSPSQSWYHIPRSFLKPRGNLLVIFEEETSNPLGITIDTVSVTQVCGQATESGKRLVFNSKLCEKSHKIHLKCPPGKLISKILFASFGNPTGDCNNYTMGNCHSTTSRAVAEKACLGKNMCSLHASYKRFGDPCPGIRKNLLVAAECQVYIDI